jgi:hypothetical protein
MTSTKTAIVIRGVVDTPAPAAIAEQREVERRALGFGARNCRARRYFPGEIVELPASDAEHLAATGFVRIVG